MSHREIAVSVRGLSKNFTIEHDATKHTTLAAAMLHALRKPISNARFETFWALRNVDFEIKKGDVVGIIGRNGAGKSTLLKILSRIMEPTEGRIDLYGRVGSLLEVGTGFHPELTGRENIYMNGAILGMTKREITREFDAIVDFSEVERFLDTPVKRYSSGMYVRLAFAVAAHLNPEILIVDEVLAVGDADFQRKCLGKMQDVAHHQGRTVIFVSHNMTAVQALCNRAVMLMNGTVRLNGDVMEASALYQSTGSGAVGGGSCGSSDLTCRKNPHLDGQLLIRRVSLRNSRGQMTDTMPIGDDLSLAIDVEGLSEYRGARVGVKIRSDQNEWLIASSTEMNPAHIVGPRRQREQVVMTIPRLPLTPGFYWFDIDIDQPMVRMLDQVEHAIRLELVEADVYGNGCRVESGVVFVDAHWRITASEMRGPANDLAQNSNMPRMPLAENDYATALKR